MSRVGGFTDFHFRKSNILVEVQPIMKKLIYDQNNISLILTYNAKILHHRVQIKKIGTHHVNLQGDILIMIGCIPTIQINAKLIPFRKTFQ